METKTFKRFVVEYTLPEFSAAVYVNTDAIVYVNGDARLAGGLCGEECIGRFKSRYAALRYAVAARRTARAAGCAVNDWRSRLPARTVEEQYENARRARAYSEQIAAAEVASGR